MPATNLLPIGRVRKAHGIKGEVSVEYYADSPLLLDGGVYLFPSGSAQMRLTPDMRLHEVTACRTHHGTLLITFANISDRNAAEALRGLELYIPESRLPEPGDDEVYLYQLIGLTALDVTGDEAGPGVPLGVVSAVTEHAGQELWTISMPGQADVLFPATPEFVLDFDLANGTVRIAPPPGLVDLYRA